MWARRSRGSSRKIHVEVGSVVKSGDLVAEIDAVVFTANVDARRASLRNLRATQSEKEAQAALAQLQYTRQKNLMAADATTTESLQQAEATLASTKAQIEAVKAQIEQTSSTLRADEANLNFTKIFAPISGTVVSITARQGQTLNTNQTAPIILRVADLSTMTVQAQVSEADVGKMRQGMEAYFTTLGSQGRRWHGTLRKIEPTPNVTNNVVLYNALFDVANPNQALMPNMTAQVFFVAASAKDAVLVPQAAVQMGGRGAGGRRDQGQAGATASSAPAPAGSAPAAADAASAPPLAAQASGPAGGDEAMRSAQAAVPEARAASGSASHQARRDRRRSAVQVEAAASAAAQGASAPVDASTRAVVWGGPSVPQARGPRRATIRVIDEAGRIEERPVQLGVSNRVQVQVLDGLAEGEQVIAGLKLPPTEQQAGGGSQARSSGLQQGGPGGMPPLGGVRR